MRVLLLSAAAGPAESVWPALGLLPRHVRLAPLSPSAALDCGSAEIVVVDTRADLALGRSIARILKDAGAPPTLLLLGDAGWSVVAADWGACDAVSDIAGPAEVNARFRLAVEHADATQPAGPQRVEAGELEIDPEAYTARLRGVSLDLTYKEFELLRYLAERPGRVFTRAQLLQEVWGYDYYGGTRTVDVHVRRLRAKLGSEYDQFIGTVRNVGYRFDAAGGVAGG